MIAVLFVLLALLTRSFARVTEYPACKEVTFTVSGTAQNRNISSLDFTDLEALTAAFKANDFPTFEVSSSQEIAGWYCEPSHRVGSIDKLQILNGPITTNREYWTALGGTGLNFPPLDAYQPETYSWVEYARREGYATLTIDHLGTGKSSHPDPAEVAQGPYETELYHDLAQQIKTGEGSPLPRTFEHLVYVGCSYGSELGNLLAQAYPDDFGEMILTGWSRSVLPSLPGVAALGAMPASQVDAERFGDLAPGYLTTPNETTRTESFFGDPNVVDFEPEMAQLFFERKDVVSSGQFVSAYVDIIPAPAYRGRVLVLTGEQDQAFCGLGSSATQPEASCGNLLAETGELFPKAEYNWQSIPRAGHALILHKSAQQTLQVAHEFLSGKYFGK
ncbi:putative alpha/beta hydrolase-1 [Septoria linicola]|nr:putative alpha/beta hydrolase-1 [Septoria linicola]